MLLLKRALILIIFSLVALVLIAFFFWFQANSPGPHRVFFNGSVITMNANNQITEAVSIRDGLIEAVGSNDDVLKLTSDETIMTDLQGRTLAPGFIDPHSHFPASGIGKVTADVTPSPIGSTDSIRDLLDTIETKVQETPKGEWVLGFGYDDGMLAENRHPRKQELDAISSEHPIYLWHSSGHMGVGNTKALEHLGISEQSPNPDGGVIGRDKNTGALTGLLQESAAPSLSQLLKDLSLQDYYRIFNSATHEYAEQGFTTVQNAKANLQLIKVFSWVSKLNLTPFRIIMLPDAHGLEHLSKEERHLDAQYNSEKFTIGPVKLVADGSIQGYTAYLSEPYYQPNSLTQDNPNYRGFPLHSREQLTELITDYHLNNFQIGIHANGDAAIDDIIYAFREAKRQGALQANKPKYQDDPRFTLIHAQSVREDQLVAMKELGITPSFFAIHTYYWGETHTQKTLGPVRGAKISPTKSAENLGMRFTIHTDTPVTPMTSLLMLWAAQTRESVAGNVIGAEERISRLSALKAITIDAAWQVFMEDSLGSIEQGKHADLVVLSDNYLDESVDIRKLEVLETIVSGKTIYRR